MTMTDQAPSDGLRSAQTDDLVLLARYADSGDAEAFQILVARYQSLVWSACQRILGNTFDAEDAVQKVFLALAKSAGSIKSNLAAWLHTTAVNRSTSLVRSTAARRKRERQHIESRETVEDENAWNEMRDLIDVCLAELNEADRELVIQRFYRGMTQLEIGERLGIGQQAVGVRLEKIIEHLRRALRRRGLPVTAAALAGALKAGLAEASAPAHLAETLGKIGILGVGYSKPSTTASLAIVAKVALALIPAALCLLAAWLFWGRSDAPLSSVLAQVDAARSIQYAKTRRNSLNARSEVIEPQDVLDSSTQRYLVLDGYLERVDDLDQNGAVVSTMIANYRTGEIVLLNMHSKTYTTNVILKRQQNALPGAPDQAELRKLAPQTDLANYLAQFSPDAVEMLADQDSEGRDLVGYRIESTLQGSVWRRTLWVDPESMRPVRTKVTFRNDHPAGGASDWVCENFVFDAELPRSLFSTNPPAGFKLKNVVRRAGKGGMSGIPLP